MENNCSQQPRRVMIRVWSNTKKSDYDTGRVIWSYPMTAYSDAIAAMYNYARRMFPPSRHGFWYRFEIIDADGGVIRLEFQPPAA